MPKINIQTSQKTVPMIYAYTTPEIARHDGWTKIGYTEQGVDKRIKQQTHTADVEYKEEWRGNAIFEDGSGDTFTDTDFHMYLKKNDVEQEAGKDNEWFHITGPASKIMFYDFKSNRGILDDLSEVIPYALRKEQQEAVDRAKDYFLIHDNGEYLYNAKPRFGKTLTVYDLCMSMQCEKVLIVTNRPAIANSWYDDYAKFIGRQNGYFFVSSAESISKKPLVVSLEEYKKDTESRTKNGIEPMKMICFLSLQDLKGSKYFGGTYEKLKDIKTTKWDILVIDEAHEGVDTLKTDVAFDQIKRKYTLHLSGTPFKALANAKFSEKAIFNWTYADEQRAKRDWDSDEENPYINLPQLNMFTYQMSEIIKDELSQGIVIDGETEEYAFDLNEFFMTNGNGTFIHNEAVNQFLNAMTTQEKFPFSTDELRKELKHTIWLLNRVDSARALARKLENHPVFKDYKVVLAAGDGRIDDNDELVKSFDKVKQAIDKYDKTITLSVGQLTTGVTIPEWTAVLMLSSIKSPSLYMQAAFRAQNPCLFSENGAYYRKLNAYVFDFDPARTLIIFEQFANDLIADTADGKGDAGTREENIRELLNFFPVIGEDENGEMIELDAEKVLSIPRKIKSREVVKRGFMCDYLFQNISNVFRAPAEVIDIIKAMDKAKDEGPLAGMDQNTAGELSLNEDGEVELPTEDIIGTAADLFGEKIFSDAKEKVSDVIAKTPETQSATEQDKYINQLKKAFHTEITDSLITEAKNNYGSDMSKQSERRLQQSINTTADNFFDRAAADLKIKQQTLDEDLQKALDTAMTKADTDAITKQFEDKHKALVEDFKQNITDKVDEMVKDAGEKVVDIVETEKKEKAKRTIEDDIRDHLRGFSRTIPSFLMAYGSDHEVTLENFDTIIPDQVFLDVTSITIESFRFLRDGGDFTNKETGEIEHFKGNLFDPVVFNDSIKEFMRLKKTLADYFNEGNKEDIFDYIPPQQTNQIFTPKKVVANMISMLEDENPGCFDDPDKTFADLYMKSGIYLTEIVKRLYRSERMKMLFPDDAERLKHIFANQVFGLAPTEIIYRIVLAYVLGFDDTIHIEDHNLRLCDALEYAKSGNLEEKLIELFGDKLTED